MLAFYDLEHGPISYDFATWLVRVKQVAGDEALHVVVVPKEDGLGGFARHWGMHDEAATRWRLWHIVLPLCQLAGATVTLAPSRRLARDWYLLEDRRGGLVYWPDGKAHFIGPLVTGAREGKPVPRLRASDEARRVVARWLSAMGRPVVTLTLRCQATDPARNSDFSAWCDFSRWLTDSGHIVLMLDDTKVALVEQSGQFATLDIDLRLALYEAAYCNVIGNNGPLLLLWLSEGAPFLQLCAGMPEDPYREHWRVRQGLDWGDQLPWATPKQRLAYRLDTFDGLKAEFEAWDSATR